MAKVRYASIKFDGKDIDTFLTAQDFTNKGEVNTKWTIVFYFGDITFSYDLTQLKKIVTLAEHLRDSSKPEDWVDEEEVKEAYAKRQRNEL